MKTIRKEKSPSSPGPETQKLQALVKEVTSDALAQSKTYLAETVVPEGGE
ncbi:MAG: hypothetical protein K0U98_01485 [Deltaproteobacteria bacterium]|nr:hypothetical protein [Deltaproteobacteria bacterium]